MTYQELLDDNLKTNLDYLKLLSKQHPTISSACTEIINLQAILNLPKGTEHFITDVHGEYEAFIHVLKNASGVIKRKIEDIFGTSLRESEKKKLATLIYYPEQKIEIILKDEPNINDWYKITLYRLIEICRVVSSKYTRSKVRKALPEDFAYIIEELLHEHREKIDKKGYYEKIVETIIRIDRAKEFITALSKFIQRIVIDRLHIIGDIFDRGPGAHIILDALAQYHSFDIQWGNHDILWMGAASGSEACIATVIRIAARYANLDTIEDGYGINLLPLATFALEFYSDDPCANFKPKTGKNRKYSETDEKLISKMHKAISIIQFKLEGQIIKRNPKFELEDRLLLDKINLENGTIIIDSKIYKLNDTLFPTIDPNNPYELTGEEKNLMSKLKCSFSNSDKLQSHIRLLFAKGSIYLEFNSNLLYHGCVPMNEDGSFKVIDLEGKKYCGKQLLEKFENILRRGYFVKGDRDAKLYEVDMIWYLWAGKGSPLFGKEKMATFERYFIDDEKTHIELKNPYYHYCDCEDAVNKILIEFGLEPDSSHIINGHVPVEVKRGESPIKANGKLLIIDGGFSKTYQSKTGIGGYTLIYNSYGLQLVSHEPFESTQKAIEEEKDILSSRIVLEKVVERKTVKGTDIGKELEWQITNLEMLLMAYRKGLIKEQK